MNSRPSTLREVAPHARVFVAGGPEQRSSHDRRAGFDDVDLAHQVWPPLTTVRQPTARIAREATNLLIDALEGLQIGPMHRVLETTLVARASTGARCS